MVLSPAHRFDALQPQEPGVARPTSLQPCGLAIVHDDEVGYALPMDAARHTAHDHNHLRNMNLPTAIGVGAVLGLALGVVVSLTTDVPVAPEVGLVLGALLGWLWRRQGA